MFPRLLTTPFFTLHTFGLLLAAAYLSSLWWLTRGARREGLDPDAFMSIGMWAIGGAIIGAKLLMVVRSLPEYIANPSLFWSISLLTSAGDFYGGFIGGVLGFVLYFWFHSGFSFWRAADLCGPAIALGQAIGRIGCLMATNWRRSSGRTAASRAAVRIVGLSGAVPLSRVAGETQTVGRPDIPCLHSPVRRQPLLARVFSWGRGPGIRVWWRAVDFSIHRNRGICRLVGLMAGSTPIAAGAFDSKAVESETRAPGPDE